MQRRQFVMISSGLGGILMLPIGLAVLMMFVVKYAPDLAQITAAPYWISLYPFSALLSLPISYAVIVWGTIGLLAASLIFGRISPSRKLFHITAIITLSAISILAPSTPIKPSADYTMQVPTQPPLLIRGVRLAQDFSETKACRYEIIGWDDAQQLYYKSSCGKQFWMTDTNGKTQKLASIPALPDQNKVKHTEILDTALDRTNHSARFDTAELAIRGTGFYSLDGQHIAITARHIYGPEDVVILSKVAE